MSEQLYRFLAPGEFIQSGDESPDDKCAEWLPVDRWSHGAKYSSSQFKIIRRRATPPAASAGEVEWLCQQRKLVLWCMHILGMDEVHAARDYDHACAMAAELSASLAGKLPPKDDILVLPIVAPWPWGAEAHAEDLIKTERIEAETRAARAALSGATREGGA